MLMLSVYLLTISSVCVTVVVMLMLSTILCYHLLCFTVVITFMRYLPIFKQHHLSCVTVVITLMLPVYLLAELSVMFHGGRHINAICLPSCIIIRLCHCGCYVNAISVYLLAVSSVCVTMDVMLMLSLSTVLQYHHGCFVYVYI